MKVAINSNEKSKYKEALKQQIKFHGQGFIAMVELTPCKTEKEAKDYIKEFVDPEVWKYNEDKHVS